MTTALPVFSPENATHIAIASIFMGVLFISVILDVCMQSWEQRKEGL